MTRRAWGGGMLSVVRTTGCGLGEGKVGLDGLEDDGGTVACYDGESWGTGGKLRGDRIS